VHFQLYQIGSLICFLLIAALLVFFVVRIDRNRRRADAALAALRERAAEEDHIVRLGLLATGAAHELGTPLASMSVILGDWMHHPTFAADPDLAEDVAVMQAELKRCKSILSGILISGGEIRGENPQVTSVRAFLNEVVEDWRERSPAPSSSPTISAPMWTLFPTPRCVRWWATSSTMPSRCRPRAFRSPRIAITTRWW
jgi:two-component system sensor histidine kinase RegB